MAIANLFTRLVVLLFLLTVCFSRSPNTSPYHLSAFYERIAKESYSPSSAARAVQILNRMMSTHRVKSLPVRMLFTPKEQIGLFAQLGIVLNDTQKEELEETPDVCHNMATFMAFVFDSTTELLKHGAGWDYGCMRAFQQVVHMRAVLTAVLHKMRKRKNSAMSEVVCVDKAIIAMYGWLHGTLIGLARNAGTYQYRTRRSSLRMAERLEGKRRIAVETRMDEDFDATMVKPVPGRDFPRVRGLKGCFDGEGYTVKEEDDDDDGDVDEGGENDSDEDNDDDDNDDKNDHESDDENDDENNVED